MSDERPEREDVRTEYAVIGSYVTALTGMRFQTVTVRLLGLEPWVPHGVVGRVLRHEFAIDVVFVGVAAYAVTLFF